VNICIYIYILIGYTEPQVLCDDGVDVRTFLRQKAPEGRQEVAIVEAALKTVGFPEEFKATFVNSLSGGWKMRMSVALSIMHEPELLLLDEPTNHLDREAVDWLTNHLHNLKDVTIAVVSHDYDFIDSVCTDITHYDNGGQLGALIIVFGGGSRSSSGSSSDSLNLNTYADITHYDNGGQLGAPVVVVVVVVIDWLKSRVNPN